MINARRAGHNFERTTVQEMKELGFTRCTTSRYSSREKDDQKVDLCYTEPFSIQTKRVNKNIPYHDILKQMPIESSENINVILHRKNHKGDVAIMSKRSFYLLVYVFNEWKRGHK